MHAGDADEAERLIAPLRAAAGPALLEGFGSGRFGDVSIGGTAPRHLDLFERLPDDVLDFVVEAGEDEGLGISTIEIRHWGGAMARPAADAGPVSDRRARFSVIADSAAPALAETLRPHALGGTFLNFLSDTKRTASAYTAGDWARLREVKASLRPAERLQPQPRHQLSCAWRSPPSPSSRHSVPGPPISDTPTGRPLCDPRPAGSAATGKPVQFQ